MISVSHLTKEFRLTKRSRREMGEEFKNAKTIKAVNNISFECKSANVFGLIGPNGAGKTTILRMIATMLKPTLGTINVDGCDTQEESEKVRQKIGFMTGQTALYDRLTPTEMVKYMADLYGMDTDQFEERKDRLFTLLDMNDFANRRIARLSTGMKQKVSIARTIIHDPPVMIFDEPTSGLDIVTSRAIVDLIRSCKQEGKTVLFSSHRMGEIKLLCDDIAIIHNGKLYFNGVLKDFESQMTKSTFEDEFIHLTGEV